MPDGAPPRLRILIAEDETIIRLDLRDVLERAGHDVCAEARDGEEAVALAHDEQPELAILDVKMPRLDGIEAARRILAERPIPIVMLTAYGQEELVARAVEAGVFGYLVKPFRETDLLPAIQTARARHAELDRPAFLEMEHEAVKLSLANLRTFPWIAEREQSGSLKLHGAHFSISEGRLYVLDEAEGTFHPV